MQSAESTTANKNRLSSLWTDNRKYTARFFLSIAPVAAFVFTFFFYAPFEMTASNQSSLAFGVEDVVRVMGLGSLALLLALGFGLPLLRGRVFNAITTAIAATTVCGYVQGTYLSGNLSQLTGDAVAWQYQTGDMLLNFFGWVAFFVLFFLLLYLSHEAWKNVTRLVAIVVVVAQLVSLISITVATPTKSSTVSEPTAITDPIAQAEAAGQSMYLSNQNLTDYSATGNVLVFVLDRLDYDYITAVLAENPAFFDGKLDGFTSYTNATSCYNRTIPALNFMLTNYNATAHQEPIADFLEHSWDYEGLHLLKDLNTAGYTVDLYTSLANLLGHGEPFVGDVENLSSENEGVNALRLFENLSTLTAYRYAPIAMKPFFWRYTDEISEGVSLSGNRYTIDETIYHEQLESMTLSENKRYFKFYHFLGPHVPYTLNADGTRNENGETDAIQQTMGSFQILFDAFDKMKELGIYRDATILILADHGNPIADSGPLEVPARIGLFYKPSGAEGTPLATSYAPISHRNIPATILKAAGAEYEQYGTPIEDVAEDEDIVRDYYKPILVDRHETEIYQYEIYGDAQYIENWILIDVYDAQYPYY